MDVKLPKLGEGTDSGTVVSILVKEGDRVKNNQTLIELENEKAVAPIPSPTAGTITRIHARVGQTLSVGQILVSLNPEGAAAPAAVTPAPPAKAAPPVRETAPVQAPESGFRDPVAPEPAPPPGETEVPPSPFAPPTSPSIRKMARELGLDLTRIRGSERGGRIVIGDIRAHIAQLQQTAAAAGPAPAPPSPPPPSEAIDFSRWGPITKKPMSALRRTISRRLLESWNTVPQVNQFDDADVTVITELQKKHGAAYEAKGVRLTLTPMILKAVVRSLRQHPVFNASLDEAAGEVIFKEYYHLGIAVDTEAGLVVPVLRDVDRKEILTLARELRELADKAKARKVLADDMKGATFTISNQGGIGGAHFTPIVNKPEAAILGLGRSRLMPAVKNNRIEPCLMLPLCLSYDHRLIDGASAARFMVQIVREIESYPEADLLAME